MGYWRYCSNCNEGLYQLTLEDLPTYGAKDTCPACGYEREDDTPEARIDLLIAEVLELRAALHQKENNNAE